MDATIYLALQLPAALIAATLLALWCGWGIARLALPESLRPYRALCAPLVGYALVLVVGYWHVRSVAGLGVALAALIPLTGLLNVLAWQRGGPPRVAELLRTQWSLLLVLLITLLIGIAPLIHYRHAAVIGAGWDTENYLPMAHYLQRGPVSAIAQAPSNPLRDLNASPPAIGLTLGFSVWQGSVNLVAGQEALVTFAPLLAWLRMLGVLAVYLGLRSMLRLGHGAALLGAALTSAGSLLLWVSFFNFAMQMAAWPLIPFALAIGLAAVEALPSGGSGRWRGLLVAALTLAALPVAYYPALTLVLPLAAGLAAAALSEGRHRGWLLGGGLALLALAVAAAAPTIPDYLSGFAFRYANQLTTLGVFEYIPLGVTLGVMPFALPVAPVADERLVLIGGLLLVGMAALGMWLAPQRRALIGLVVGALAYLAWLRVGQAYPYAYMKGSAYVGWVAAAAAACGWQWSISHRRLPVRALGVGSACIALAAAGASQAAVLQSSFAAPGLYAAQLPSMIGLRAHIPAGSHVLLSNDPRVQGLPSGLAAYLLDHATVVGRVRTAYGASAAAADVMPEYALLADAEDPSGWGYQDQVWSGGGFRLYRRPEQTLSHALLDLSLAPGESASLSVGADQLALGAHPIGGGAWRTLLLSVAAIEPGVLQIGGARYVIPAGGSVIELSRTRTPQLLDLRNRGGGDLLVRSATLRPPEPRDDQVSVALRPPIPGQGRAASLRAAPGIMVAQASAATDGGAIETDVTLLAHDGGPLVAALDIWDAAQARHYGWYGTLLAQRATPQRLRLRIDLASGAAQVLLDGQPAALGGGLEGIRPGTYTAQLLIGTNARSLTRPVDLFGFRVGDDGAITEIWTSATPLLATSLSRPAEPVGVRVGDDLLLEGYDLPERRLRAGQASELLLWWRATRRVGDDRSVLVHLIDGRGERVAQFDGPPALGIRPTGQWRRGDLTLDARQIMIPEGLPPGQYTLLVGMYRWPSLERLPLSRDGQRQAEDVLRIPIEVVAAPPGGE